MNELVNRASALLVAAGDKAHWTDLLHIIVEDENCEDWWLDLEDPDCGASTQERYRAAEQWERDIFDALAVLPEHERIYAIRTAESRRFD